MNITAELLPRLSDAQFFFITLGCLLLAGAITLIINHFVNFDPTEEKDDKNEKS